MIRNYRHHRSRFAQRGFTITELLIATMVFSMVLLLATAGIIQISRVYYKGVTEASTQNTARNLMDSISQAIQFSGGEVTPTTSNPVAGVSYAFCVGSQQFSYTLGWQVEDNPDTTKHQTYHAAVQNNLAGCSSGSGAQDVRSSSVSGRDLIGPHMRLANLVVSSVGTNLYRVQVRLVYGDDDLLDNSTNTTANCKNILTGTQFCSVSELSTVVVKRVK